MSKITLNRIEKSIIKIKKQILELEDMRPGSLSQQMRKTKTKYGAYWHLSYTHMGKGQTEYVRNEFVDQIKKEVATFKRYKSLSDRLIGLSIKKSRLKMELTKLTDENKQK